MIFRQFFDHSSFTYTYLLAENDKALIIDPVKEQVPDYLKVLAELELQLIYSFDTHVHADHITGSGKLCQETGCDIVMGAASKARGVTIKLDDNEALTMANISITVLYTPGHTDDSCCLLLSDRVFTGDTLFINGSGRTDFQNGDSKQAYHSIVNKLLCLPAETLVYPGHDYNGRMVSTIGEQKRFNPRLQVNSADEYAALMDKLNLAKPKLFDIAVPANLECGNC